MRCDGWGSRIRAAGMLTDLLLGLKQGQSPGWRAEIETLSVFHRVCVFKCLGERKRLQHNWLHLCVHLHAH